jgi:hypothetical protein
MFLAALSLLIINAWGCTYYAEDNPTYGNGGDASGDIWRNGQLVGRRIITVAQGYVMVQVWAYAVANPLDTRYTLDHSETAYANATRNCTIHFHSPGTFTAKPAGMNVVGHCSATGRYYLLENGGNSNFECWTTFTVHGLSNPPSSMTMNPDELNENSDDVSVAGTVPLSITGTGWVQEGENVTFEAARLSSTAHAHQGVNANSGDLGLLTIYAEGIFPYSDLNWYPIFGAAYY